jgi:pyrroloquinoline quinone biosynthesis protein B
MKMKLISSAMVCMITLQALGQRDHVHAVAEPAGAHTLTILGIAQDAGYPQIGCRKKCCESIRNGSETKRHITNLAISDHSSGKYWLFEATPDIAEQLGKMQSKDKSLPFQLPAGIFLTHGHIGHYTGLMQLGREAYGAKGVEVFAMPRMEQFLKNNGPWSQLTDLGNISIRQMDSDKGIQLSEELWVTPIRVPHRDEFTETVGFLILGKKKLLFIPDIDKWEKWDRSLDSLIQEVDLALIDGTFFDIDELPGRDMREIPHPFVTETIQKLAALPKNLRNRVMFIHFNHTNPLIRKDSPESKQITAQGFRIAREGWKFNF